jgi:hypothetical protein
MAETILKLGKGGQRLLAGKGNVSRIDASAGVNILRGS